MNTSPSDHDRARELFIIGLEKMLQQSWAEAELVFRQSLQILPGRPSTLVNLGATLIRLERLEEARSCIDQVLLAEPDHPDAWLNKGLLCAMSDDHEGALQAYGHLMRLKPDDPQVFFQRAEIYRALGHLGQAMADYEGCLQLDPENAWAYHGLASCLYRLGQQGAAIHQFDQALRLNPDLFEAHLGKGIAEKESGLLQSAVQSLSTALQLNPGEANAHLNMGLIRHSMGQLDAALQHYDRTIELDSKCAQAYNNRGVLYHEMRRLDAALSDYRRSIELNPGDPDAMWNHAQALLECKNFIEGWHFYLQRHKVSSNNPPFWMRAVDRWTWVKSLSGRVLIVPEQGVGDEIFYTKFLSLFVKRHGLPALVCVDRRLMGLLSRTHSMLKFWDRDQMEQLNPLDYDLQVAMGDLGALMGVEPERDSLVPKPHLTILSGRLPYLSFLKRDKRRPVVGLTWKSKNEKLGHFKSIGLLNMMTAFKDLDVDWVSLQYGEVGNEINEVKHKLGVHIHTVQGLDVFNDIDGLLHLISECDHVISTSNSTAHLCGAVGKSGTVVVPYSQGKPWFWHLLDESSSWYPSLQIIHAQKPQDWVEALERVKSSLSVRLGL